MERTISNLSEVKHIHLMGAGGAGMSGLALLFHELNYCVTGCDVGHSAYVDKLEKSGVRVLCGHSVSHLDEYQVDLLVYSSAIPPSNPELQEARRRGIKVVQRAELLSLLFDARQGIGVAGTHGKTTTTSMISYILEVAHFAPTVAIGGELCDIGCNAKIGKSDLMVAELDESDGSFEYFHPNYAIVTNIDWDHVNHYPSINDVEAAFIRFLCNLKTSGQVLMCGEDPGVQRVSQVLPSNLRSKIFFYGKNSAFPFYASDIQYHCGGGLCYRFHAHGVCLGRIELVVSGEHNLLDSLAACAMAYTLGVPFPAVQKALRIFHGAKRRLQLKAMCPGNILVYDDYGHHPREIENTLKALKSMYPDRRIVLVFQPHRYTRTQALFNNFARVLSTAPRVILLPIYGADEQPIQGVSSELISSAVLQLGGCCKPVENKEEALRYALSVIRQDDLVLTEGAGDVCLVGDQLIEELNRRV